MKEKLIFKIIVSGIVILYLLLLFYMIYSNISLNKINERIKKENTELKRDNKKLRKIELKYIVGD